MPRPQPSKSKTLDVDDHIVAMGSIEMMARAHSASSNVAAPVNWAQEAMLTFHRIVRQACIFRADCLHMLFVPAERTIRIQALIPVDADYRQTAWNRLPRWSNVCDVESLTAPVTDADRWPRPESFQRPAQHDVSYPTEYEGKVVTRGRGRAAWVEFHPLTAEFKPVLIEWVRGNTFRRATSRYWTWMRFRGSKRKVEVVFRGTNDVRFYLSRRRPRVRPFRMSSRSADLA